MDKVTLLRDIWAIILIVSELSDLHDKSYSSRANKLKHYLYYRRLRLCYGAIRKASSDRTIEAILLKMQGLFGKDYIYRRVNGMVQKYLYKVHSISKVRTVV